ncbi:unknown [Bacteroides finegoldii CAG:203]|nr:unknown [Bacteroides finegoldii CAG:203]
MRFRPRLCNVLLWGILYGYTETAQVALMGYTKTARVALMQPALFL